MPWYLAIVHGKHMPSVQCYCIHVSRVAVNMDVSKQEVLYCFPIPAPFSPLTQSPLLRDLWKGEGHSRIAKGARQVCTRSSQEVLLHPHSRTHWNSEDVSCAVSPHGLPFFWGSLPTCWGTWMGNATTSPLHQGWLAHRISSNPKQWLAPCFWLRKPSWTREASHPSTRKQDSESGGQKSEVMSRVVMQPKQKPSRSAVMTVMRRQDPLGKGEGAVETMMEQLQEAEIRMPHPGR